MFTNLSIKYNVYIFNLIVYKTYQYDIQHNYSLHDNSLVKKQSLYIFIQQLYIDKDIKEIIYELFLENDYE